MAQYFLYPLLLIVSLALILFACELFTNGVEWAGKKMDLSRGATGSVLAAVGTALPETSIPILALIAGNKEGMDVAVGAIAGAPFMLATLAMCVTGAAVFYYHKKGRREKTLNFDKAVKERDLAFFIGVYSVACLATFAPHGFIRYFIAACLMLSYGVYLYVSLRHKGEGHGEMDILYLSKLFRSKRTRRRFIALQIIVALGLIAAGAHYFVVAVQEVARMFSVPTLILSLLVTPIATELPEKMNSVLWIRDRKDTLALGNITGAMVFQASFPVAIGVAFTHWDLRGPTMVSAILALLSATGLYLALKIKRDVKPHVLLACGLLYAAFIVYLVFSGTSPSG
jgi:cation:H+ antiporter